MRIQNKTRRTRAYILKVNTRERTQDPAFGLLRATSAAGRQAAHQRNEALDVGGRGGCGQGIASVRLSERARTGNTQGSRTELSCAARLDQRLALEIQILKEMVGLGMRSFFNHTTPIPDATKAAAILSGKQRFHGYLDMLAKNLRKGESILSDLPLPELDPPKEFTQPPQNVEEAAPANHAQSAAKAKDRATKQTTPASAPNGARDWALFEPSGEK